MRNNRPLEFIPFDTWLAIHGLEYPHLGVNFPAGAAWAAADAASQLLRRWHADMEELNGRSFDRSELFKMAKQLGTEIHGKRDDQRATYPVFRDDGASDS